MLAQNQWACATTEYSLHPSAIAAVLLPTFTLAEVEHTQFQLQHRVDRGYGRCRSTDYFQPNVVGTQPSLKQQRTREPDVKCKHNKSFHLSTNIDHSELLLIRQFAYSLYLVDPIACVSALTIFQPWFCSVLHLAEHRLSCAFWCLR